MRLGRGDKRLRKCWRCGGGRRGRLREGRIGEVLEIVAHLQEIALRRDRRRLPRVLVILRRLHDGGEIVQRCARLLGRGYLGLADGEGRPLLAKRQIGRASCREKGRSRWLSCE